jgi:hypothetical protein
MEFSDAIVSHVTGEIFYDHSSHIVEISSEAMILKRERERASKASGDLFILCTDQFWLRPSGIHNHTQGNTKQK